MLPLELANLFAHATIVVDNARLPSSPSSHTASAEQLPALYPCEKPGKQQVARSRSFSVSRWESAPIEGSFSPLRIPVRKDDVLLETSSIQEKHHSCEFSQKTGHSFDSCPKMPRRLTADWNFIVNAAQA